MTDIVMPKLSDSMEEGTILSWLKASGDEVREGDELLEIETDKATVTHCAEISGVLEILVAEGETVAVGQPIARAGTAADSAQQPAIEAPPPSEPGRSSEQATDQAARPPSETPIGSSAVALTDATARPVAGNGDRRVSATPLARRIAATHGVVLEDIRGSGPLGRITRDDVLQRAGLPGVPSPLPRAAPPTRVSRRPGDSSSSRGIEAPQRASGPPAAAVSGRPESSSGVSRREPTRLQQLIARRMAEAKATIPHFQVQTEVVMDAAIALRAEFKQLAGEGNLVPSVNDIIIKAAALALREHPLANGSFRDGGFELHQAVNVGMAVAADEALVVPTVFDAVGKSLGQIARETRRLAARVRIGEVTPPELAGGTFTVSNLGMFGMTAITPVINPPQAAILGVGATRETLARIDGAIVERNLLTLTLSCDHRILYGADAARFLARIRQLLEAPLTMAL